MVREQGANCHGINTRKSFSVVKNWGKNIGHTIHTPELAELLVEEDTHLQKKSLVISRQKSIYFQFTNSCVFLKSSNLRHQVEANFFALKN